MENLNSNLINLVYSLKKSGQTDDVIQLSLETMGYETKFVTDAISVVNKKNEPVIEISQTPITESISLIDLYDASRKVVSVLESLSSDSIFGYSAQTAYNTIAAVFPESVVNTIEYMRVNSVSESVTDISPVMKYTIAESLYNNLQAIKNVDIVADFLTIITESLNTDKFGYLAANCIKLLLSENNSINKKFENKLVEYLHGDHDEQGLKNILVENQWSPIAARALKTFKVETPVKVLGECKEFTIVSPVISVDSSVVFNLFGNNYKSTGNTIERLTEGVDNVSYNNVLRGMSCMQYDADKQQFSYEGVNNKIVTYDVQHDMITVGDVKLDSDSILSISEGLKACGVFNSGNVQQYDSIMRLLESRSIIQNIDICRIVSPIQVDNKLCAIFESTDGSIMVDYISSTDTTSKTYNLASSASKDIETYLDCNVSKVFESRLIQENDEKAVRDAKISEISKQLDKLYDRQTKFNEAYAQLNDDMLKDALGLINEEVKKLEKQLQKLYV